MSTPRKLLSPRSGEGRFRSPALAATLSGLGKDFHSRGWILGTSGNFSVVVNPTPLRLAITVSGTDKGVLTDEHIVEIDHAGEPLDGSGPPSDEAHLHLAVVSATGAAAVLHTHSVWSTLLSEAFAGDDGLSISGYEMLKGLSGIRTHQHREWLPILENSQDLRGLAGAVRETLHRHPRSHGFLLRRHGLYTWGDDLSSARRHVEILEFLLEVVGRLYCASPGSHRMAAD